MRTPPVALGILTAAALATGCSHDVPARPAAAPQVPARTAPERVAAKTAPEPVTAPAVGAGMV